MHRPHVYAPQTDACPTVYSISTRRMLQKDTRFIIISRIMTISLKNKVVLITAGSAGLGACVARKFAAQGAQIALNYNRSKNGAEALASTLKSEFQTNIAVVQADATTDEGIKKLVDSTLASFGQLDVVISNVGWTKIVSYDDLDALDDELWDGCFNANIKSHFKLYRYCKPFLAQNAEGGTFIVTASVAGRIVYGSSIPYAVTKAGLIHLVRMLGKTHGPKVRIHAVCPGLLMTEWGKQFSEERIRTTEDMSPIGKLADVEETASHYTHLATLSTSTGTIVGIDGGISI